MYPILNQFHLLSTKDANTHLFARLQTHTLQLLHVDKAYRAEPSEASIRGGGANGPPPLSLLSLVLTAPATTANLQFSTDKIPKLHLKLKDQASITLHVTLTLTEICSQPLLISLHTSLLAAVTGMEAVLNDVTKQQPINYNDSSDSNPLSYLHAVHAPLIYDGQNIADMSPFRQAASADLSICSARAFTIAHQAADVRVQVLERRQARLDEALRRARSDQRALQHTNLNAEQNVAANMPLSSTNLFDDSITPPSDDQQQKHESEQQQQQQHSHTPNALYDTPQTSQPTTRLETPKVRPSSSSSQVTVNRRKRRKIRRLV